MNPLKKKKKIKLNESFEKSRENKRVMWKDSI